MNNEKTNNNLDALGTPAQVEMIGEEFETMSGIRIMAADYLFRDNWPYDENIEAGPYGLRCNCADNITQEFSMEGISEGEIEHRYQGYIDLHEEYGNRWVVEALGDYYRCVKKRIDWKELAAERDAEVRETYKEVWRTICRSRAKRQIETQELEREAAKVAAPQIERLKVRLAAERLEAVCQLVGRGKLKLAA